MTKLVLTSEGVVKNTILRRAAAQAEIEGLDAHFVGPTAIVFSESEVIAPAKVIAEFAKKAEKLEIKGGPRWDYKLNTAGNHRYMRTKILPYDSRCLIARRCDTLQPN